jgi:hypothetical protein
MTKYDYDYIFKFEVTMPVRVICGTEKEVKNMIRENLMKCGASKTKLISTKKKKVLGSGGEPK